MSDWQIDRQALDRWITREEPEDQGPVDDSFYDDQAQVDWGDKPEEAEESDEARERREAWERYERGPLPGMIRAATKSQQYYELGGDGGQSPLEALIADLKQAMEEAEAMLHHAHVWNGEDYCDVCGADGRA